MLLRNSIWNLCGLAFPTLVALGTVPILISSLGMEGFGVVTLIGSVVGYFGILDLNLSAGAIKYLAQFHAQHEKQYFAETFWFGLIFYGILGLTGGLIVFVSAEFLIQHIFNLNHTAHSDMLTALHIAALGFFLTQIQSYLLVIPQALQRYDYSAQSELIFGILFNVSSAAVAWLNGGIVGVIAVRVLISVLNLLFLFGMLHYLGVSFRPRLPGSHIMGLLTKFSAYAYLSRLGSLLHQHGDKLIIGSLAGPVAVTLYTVPAQLANRLLGMTFRISSVIYPRVSALSATGQLYRLRMLYLDCTRLVTYLNLSVLGIVTLCGDQFLYYWVGEQFVEIGYPILILISIAMFIDSLTNLPSLVNDGIGHPEITGRFAIVRGIAGVSLVCIGTAFFTIKGAAAAHLIASFFMSILFLRIVHQRTVPVTLMDTMKIALLPSITTGITVIFLLIPAKYFMQQDLSDLIVLTTLSVIALSVAGIIFIVKPDERSLIFSIAKKITIGT